MITTLDPKTALILIDLQKGIVSYPTAHPIGGVMRNAGALADAFRGKGLPVVLVNVTGGAPAGPNSRTAANFPPVGRILSPSSIGSPRTTLSPSGHGVRSRTRT